MGYVVEKFRGEDRLAWDEYVRSNDAGNYCHLSGWQTVIQRSYGRPTHFWVCRDTGGRIVGLLPTVHLKHPLFGNSLVSMPYLDGGGILADDPAVYQELLAAGREIAVSENIPFIELRHFSSKPSLCEGKTEALQSDKVQMIIKLENNIDKVFNSFKQKNKVRTAIRKAERLKLIFVLGGSEKLNHFYKVFAMNQRELGTPVHSRCFFAEVFQNFANYVHIGVVYLNSIPIAAGIIFCFKDMVSFPWGGFIRSFHHYNPFPFLVWEFIKFSIDNDYKFFDFGRSSINSSQYEFKRRWGAQPYPLHWQQVRLHPGSTVMESRRKFLLFTKIWKRLPLPVTILCGPGLRKYISL